MKVAGEKTPGIIIKQSDFGEGHRMLWIFTERFGIIKAVAHGAEKVRSKAGAATQFLSYCDFIFYESGEIWNINSVTAKETFWPVQEDIKKLSLCTYFADLVFYTLDLHNPDVNVLRLFLNILYAVAYRDVSLETVKVAFETKLMYLAGFLPRPDCCTVCGCVGEIRYFNKKSGAVLCRECAKGSEVKIDDDTYKTLYYLALCDVKKMFSCIFPENGIRQLASIMEEYVIKAEERAVKSLEYYKMF